jgi:glycosyltransferase involved in cell wall biosynthesis
MSTLGVLHTEASRGWGGQEVRIITEARWLSERGVRVAIAAWPGSRLENEAGLVGLSVSAIRMRGAWDLVAAHRLARLVRRQRIDIVHTHSSVDAWIGGIAARLSGVPVVRSRHVSIPIRRRLNPVYGWFADRVVTSGEAIRGLVVAGGVDPGKVVAIPAGVDLAEFAPAAATESVRREFGDGAPIIGSVAMFRGSKGHDHLLEAFGLVRANWPRARLLLVGDGLRRRWAEGLAAANGLGGAVHFTGFRKDVADLLRLMDCFVLASTRTEGVPQSLLQAIAVGTPVVASRVGGIPEVIVDGETGLLVDPGRPAALAEAIGAVVRDQDSAVRRAAAARRIVQSRFSHTTTVDRLLALYRELVAHESNRRSSAGGAVRGAAAGEPSRRIRKSVKPVGGAAANFEASGGGSATRSRLGFGAAWGSGLSNGPDTVKRPQVEDRERGATRAEPPNPNCEASDASQPRDQARGKPAERSE